MPDKPHKNTPLTVRSVIETTVLSHKNMEEEHIEILGGCTDGPRVERITSRGHTSPPDFWYDQDTAEWVMVIRGSAKLEIIRPDTQSQHHKSINSNLSIQEVTLKEGDYILIPAHTKHRVSWTDPTCDTTWLAFHFPPK